MSIDLRQDRLILVPDADRTAGEIAADAMGCLAALDDGAALRLDPDGRLTARAPATAPVVAAVAIALETRQFVVNLATWDLREAMNASSVPAPAGVDEFEVAGLARAASEIVTPPRVAASPVHLECEVTQSVHLPSEDGDDNTVVFGRVLGVHLDESILTDGRVDMAKLQPIGRLGGRHYVAVREVFTMDRPTWEGRDGT